MQTYAKLVKDALERVDEIFPWDLEERFEDGSDLPLIIDIREPYEFEFGHIKGSISVPRGILEGACEWDYDDTIPELVEARERDVIVVCRSGNRSVLAADVMLLLGYKKPVSLKTGLRGWNDYEQPLLRADGTQVEQDDADEYFEAHVREDQLHPDRRSTT